MTAYEMRISDWSSDVCSSDLQWQKCPDPYAEDPSDPAGWTWTENPVRQLMHYKLVREKVDYATKIAPTLSYWQAAADVCDEAIKIGRASCRERVCQYV